MLKKYQRSVEKLLRYLTFFEGEVILRISTSGRELVLSSGRKLRVVVVDRFYDVIEMEPVKKLFSDIAEFKIRSYLKEYPYGILPFGGHDLVGTHLLLCDETAGELVPLVGFKAVTAEQCKMFHLEFPALAVCAENSAKSEYAAIEQVVADGEKMGFQVGYIGSWTIDPEARKSKILKKICYDITAAFVGWWCTHYGIRNIIAFASLKFQIEKFHKEMGFSRLTLRGAPLSDFTVKSHFDDLVCTSILQKENISKKVKDLMGFYGDLWDQRIYYGKLNAHLDKKAA